jgi:hypothetical protein
MRIYRAAGWALVADDPVQAADVIVVAIDTREEGVLEAADLVASGVARTVALFPARPDAVDHEFARRGIPHENDAERAARLLKALGVEQIEWIPVLVAGTEDEGLVLPGWFDQRRFRTVVVVTNADHSRRLRRVMRRAMRNRATRVIVRRSRYSAFDPDRWWLSRGGTRREFVEFEKLLFDVVRHPIS